MEKIDPKKAVDKAYHFFKNHWGEVYAVYDVLSSFLGGKTRENAPPEVKRLAGIFGSGDEIKFINAVRELRAPDQKLILGLIQYHFGGLTSPRIWVRVIITFISFLRTNNWRTLVTNLDEPQKKVGEQKTVAVAKSFTDNQQNQGQRRGAPGNTTTTTSSEEIYGGGKKNTTAFLKQIVKVIKDAEKTAPTELDDQQKRNYGYDAAITYMRSLGMPLMPSQEVIDWIDGCIPETFGDLSSLSTGVTEFNRQHEARFQAIEMRPYGLRWLSPNYILHRLMRG